MSNEEVERLIISNAQTVAKLVQVTQQTSKDVDKLTKYMEESKITRERFYQLKKACEKEIEEIKEDIKGVKKQLLILKPVFTIIQYPKVTVLAIIGSYALAISDVRNVIFRFLGWM